MSSHDRRFKPPSAAVHRTAPAARQGAGDDAVAATDVAAADAALLVRVVTEEREEALGELYDRYARQIFRLGLRLLGEREAAEELVQETFVRLWRSAASFDDSRSSVRTYTMMLARRTAVDFQRRAAARPPSALSSPQETNEPTAHDNFDALLADLEVREALEALAPRQREVLELAYDDDLSQLQIAQRLDVPVGTVKSRTHHALRALKRELSLRGFDA